MVQQLEDLNGWGRSSEEEVRKCGRVKVVAGVLKIQIRGGKEIKIRSSVIFLLLAIPCQIASYHFFSLFITPVFSP